MFKNISIEKTVKVMLAILFVLIMSIIYFSYDASTRSYHNFVSSNNLSQQMLLMGKARYQMAVIRANINGLDGQLRVNEKPSAKYLHQTQEYIKITREEIHRWADAEKLTMEGRQVADDMTKRFDELLDIFTDALAKLRKGQLTTHSASQKMDELNEITMTYYAVANGIENNYIDIAKTSQQRIMLMALVTAIIVIMLFIIILRWFSHSFIGNIKVLINIFSKMSQGDLSMRVENHGNNEFGKLFNEMNKMKVSLSQMIASVKNAVNTISVSASEIATGNTDLSSRTEEQASALQQTVASMEQIKTTVEKNADNSRQASQLALRATTSAQNGEKVMDNVIETMSSISESAKKISDINDIINSIANQTNILSLNAAVEAARAGEQGRGFAVVAAEVRNLASRSAEAAKEINELITHSVNKVQVGSQQVSEAGRSMSEIVTTISQVNDFMQQIALASNEQSMGINQIAMAVSEMDTVTQQNAALVEESATITANMDDEAHQLANLVSQFKVDEKENTRQA
ncbi:HAMP domain-containing protein [Proteus mirabilis]|uniref:methyl-accepting chemotaxis protein n=1 Tax=Proteus mirabilis TaxID=584 RepID=UPI00257798A6|nr:methyl-accepting chemotaxis protein [Proteus mirabilis]MDM3574403.1 methyl-accepting chemotaxis protein [Proteus mirabilis]HEJ0062241.1 HAMP domain-containing protein [Proteus mirabilis]